MQTNYIWVWGAFLASFFLSIEGASLGETEKEFERTLLEEEKHPAARRAPSRSKSVDPDKFLEQFGYLQKLPGDVQHSDEARREALRHFQRMYGMKATGELDQETLDKMALPRCGMKDMIPGGEIPDDVMLDPGALKASNYYAPGYKWSKTDLTWRALDYSYDMDPGQQRLAFYDAFKYWSKVAPLNFREIGGGKADIEIKFGHGDHGDSPGNEFDGEGGILAHAYYPEDGGTHFDEAETWTEGTEQGTNLRIVAAHEFGHALGLGHSNARGALMAPYYQGYQKDFKLHQDDIQGIQSLYGSRTPKPTPRPTPRPTTTTRRPTTTTRRPWVPATTSKPPSSKPDSCTVRFEAVYQAHDYRTYVITGTWVWRLDDWQAEQGYPISIYSLYQNPPYNIEAAVYSWRTRYTYFFKGNRVFKYYGFQRIEQKDIDDAGYPKVPQAALMGRDGVIYLLKGAYYYVFDEYKMTVTDTRPRSIASKWRGVTPNVAAAVTLRDGYTYFFKGSRYRKYDERYQQVLPGYPKHKAGPWMGPRCGGKYVPK